MWRTKHILKELQVTITIWHDSIGSNKTLHASKNARRNLNTRSNYIYIDVTINSPTTIDKYRSV
ncbi:hypothetical protein ALQ05_200206 [Pseudomonas amygdali pv. mori]|uniref:Uncharacterized protein n=1 Tax=Pseudomonas amygdali pv. mori TaxID=34065 RepID=A0A3M4KMX6_PSEA0|nr:hypothetical protein ALQ05_200206 [Pseudomonas amygdali pv. mori]